MGLTTLFERQLSTPSTVFSLHRIIHQAHKSPKSSKLTHYFEMIETVVGVNAAVPFEDVAKVGSFHLFGCH